MRPGIISSTSTLSSTRFFTNLRIETVTPLTFKSYILNNYLDEKHHCDKNYLPKFFEIAKQKAEEHKQYIETTLGPGAYNRFLIRGSDHTETTPLDMIEADRKRSVRIHQSGRLNFSETAPLKQAEPDTDNQSICSYCSIL